MIMLVSEYINAFISPAKLAVAKYTEEIDQLKDKGSEYDDLVNTKKYNRFELYAFLELIAPTVSIVDGTNFCTWTDKEIIEEIQYLENKNNLKTFPATTFNSYNPKVINGNVTGTSDGSTGVTWPTGTYGQILEYNALGVPVATDFNKYGGMLTDDIDTYFQGRT